MWELYDILCTKLPYRFLRILHPIILFGVSLKEVVFLDNASFTVNHHHKWRLKTIRGMIVFIYRRIFDMYSHVVRATQWEAD